MGIPSDYSAYITKPGQKNLTGDAYAMMLEKFTGEVLFQTHAQSVTEGVFQWTPLIGTDTMSNAAMGDPVLMRLESGITPNASKIEVGSQVVQVRKPVIARVAIGVLDDVQDRLNVRGRTPARMGKVISKITDQVLLHQCVKSALLTVGAHGIDELGGGARIEFTAAGQETNPDLYESALRSLMVAIMNAENEVSDGVLYLPPAQFGVLLDNDKLVSNLYSQGADFGSAFLSRASGFMLKPTTRLPNAAKTEADVGSAPYLFGANYVITAEHTDTVGLYAKTDAIMIAEAIPITSEIWWDQGSKTHILDAYFAFGAGPNDPSQAGVVLKYRA